MLQLEGISRNYKTGPAMLEVLKGIDLEVDEGELVSIMGTSGSGKSTLMNVIGLLDRPTSGNYRIDGKDVLASESNDLAHLRNRNIGFVFQSFHLLPRLTALKNVELPLLYRGASAEARRTAAIEWLQRVGMEDRMDHKPNELSGGQRQRVAIARALVGRPRLILADEPTGALDEKTGTEIMDLFINLNLSEKVTVIIITHDAKVGSVCRRRLVLKNGLLSAASDSDT